MASRGNRGTTNSVTRNVFLVDAGAQKPRPHLMRKKAVDTASRAPMRSAMVSRGFDVTPPWRHRRLVSKALALGHEKETGVDVSTA